MKIRTRLQTAVHGVYPILRAVSTFAAVAALCLSTLSHAYAMDGARINVALQGFVGGDTNTFLGTVSFNLTAHAAGSDLYGLTGHGSWIAVAGDFPGNEDPESGFFFLESSNFEVLSGWSDGDSVVLEGIARRSLAPPVVGLPVRIEASSTGHIRMIHGPFTSGPFKDLTFEFEGWGQVNIKVAP